MALTLSLSGCDILTGLLGKKSGGTSYQITYSANGGIGSLPIDSRDYTTGEIATIIGNTGNITRDGYSFDGWNSKADGSGTSYAPGGSITIAKADIILYAKWVPAAYSIAITQATGGSISVSPAQATYAAGDQVTLTATPDADFAFTAWGGDISGTTNPMTITISSSISITASYATTLHSRVATHARYDYNGSTPVLAYSETNSYAIALPGATLSVVQSNASGASTRRTDYTRDSLGRTMQKSIMDTSTTPAALLGAYMYSYDSAYQDEKPIRIDYKARDAYGYFNLQSYEIYEYDSSRRQTVKKQYNSTDILTRSDSSSYDANGRYTGGDTYINGAFARSKTAFYDSLGNRIRTEYRTASNVLVGKDEYAYDAQGNILRCINYWDDGLDNIVAETKDEYTYETYAPSSSQWLSNDPGITEVNILSVDSGAIACAQISVKETGVTATYAVTPLGASSVTIGMAIRSSSATATINGSAYTGLKTLGLVGGGNTITVIITAQDGVATFTYSFTINN